MLSSILPAPLSSILPIAMCNTLPACLSQRSEVSSPNPSKYTPSVLPSTPLITFPSSLSSMQSNTLPIANNASLPASLTICSWLISQDTPKYTSKYIVKYPPEHALKNARTCTQWPTPSLLDYTLAGKLSRRSQVYSQACSQVHSPEASHSQSHFTIYSHLCSWVLDPRTGWDAGTRNREAGGWRRSARGQW